MSPRHLASLLPLLLALAACGHGGTVPRTMDAPDNRAAADAHRDKAAAEAAKYDPSAVVMNVTEDGVEFYNPTAHHKAVADRELAEARAHEREANKLEALDDAACAAIPGGTRASCPLLGTIVALQVVEGGARVKLKDASQLDATVARMRCHAAYARLADPEGLDMCPLYVDGLRIDVQGEWIVFRSPTPGGADKLIADLREHLPTRADKAAGEQ